MVIETIKPFLGIGENTYKVVDYKPLAHSPVNKAALKKYNHRICEIDGGGIKGVLPAYELYAMEAELQCSTLSLFDVFWGTSTGGIIVAMIAMGFSAREILQFYIELGPTVFAENFAWGLLGNIYNPKKFEEVVKQYFKDITFKKLFMQSGVELNILATDAIARKTLTLNYKNTPNMPIWAAVRATMSAPVYFGAFEFDGKVYYDGGTGIFGCSVLKAFNNAYYKKQIDIKDIFILSMGTGIVKTAETPKSILRKDKIAQALWTFDFSREEAVTSQIEQLGYLRTDIGLNYLRWDTVIPESLSAMDKTNNIAKLISLVDRP